jgi:glycosyltransferase involved in cell wall biosynthesis
MDARPKVSVVICAYTERRWHDLGDAVASAASQADAAEVLVVIDHAPALLARARAEWPQHVVLPNAHRQGLSGARNTGTEAAAHELVAYLDDDAIAAEGWLAPLVDVLLQPHVVGAGGKAVPIWPKAAPAFLPPELNWIIGCTFTGQPAHLERVRNVMGCSMLFRRDPVLAIGGFSSDTGRIGTIPLGGEETDLCIRLRQEQPDALVYFEPRSVVRHRVSADRVKFRYLCRRSFYEGVSKAVLSTRLGADDALESERRYTLVVLPVGVIRALLTRRPLAAVGIVTAFSATVAGYLYARVTTVLRRPSASAA